MKTTQEGSRGHHTAVDPKELPGGAGRPHPYAARFGRWPPTCLLPECSSNTS
jgi:hypothetical protein